MRREAEESLCFFREIYMTISVAASQRLFDSPFLQYCNRLCHHYCVVSAIFIFFNIKLKCIQLCAQVFIEILESGKCECD